MGVRGLLRDRLQLRRKAKAAPRDHGNNVVNAGATVARSMTIRRLKENSGVDRTLSAAAPHALASSIIGILEVRASGRGGTCACSMYVYIAGTAWRAASAQVDPSYL